MDQSVLERRQEFSGQIAARATKDDLRGELVPDDISKVELCHESAVRMRNAGYDVTSEGGRPQPKIMAVVPWGYRHYNLWPRDKHGHLIGD